MEKKKKSNSGKLFEGLPRKHEDESPDKRYPNPDDPNEETGPPIKEMPIKDGAHHEEPRD